MCDKRYRARQVVCPRDSLELITVSHECGKKGRYKIAAKVTDISGSDTTKVVEVKV